jgi:hypothetical protein
MLWIYIIGGLAFAHYAFISQLSLITGQYRRRGWLPMKPLLFERSNLLGVAFLVCAGIVLAITLRSKGDPAAGMTVATALMLGDLLCVYRAVRRTS